MSKCWTIADINRILATTINKEGKNNDDCA